jgi:hypothetical protein
MGFIGENLGKAKGLRFVFPLAHVLLLLLWGFNRYKEWTNSIKLKKLQIVNGILRKGDEGLGFLFLFQKGFFWVRRGGWGNSTPFQRRNFLRDWDT